jgi:predicted nucleotidyltransferase
VIVVKKIQVQLPKDRIVEFCKKWKIREFSLFGSVLRADFHPQSDIDVIVDFENDKAYSLLDLISMQDELETIFGRKIDLITRTALDQSRNYIRRKAIKSSMEVIYVS